MIIDDLVLGLKVKIKLNYDRIIWISDYSCILQNSRVWINKEEIPVIGPFEFSPPKRNIEFFTKYKKTKYFPSELVSYVIEDIKKEEKVIVASSAYEDLFFLKYAEGPKDKSLYISQLYSLPPMGSQELKNMILKSL